MLISALASCSYLSFPNDPNLQYTEQITSDGQAPNNLLGKRFTLVKHTGPWNAKNVQDTKTRQLAIGHSFGHGNAKLSSHCWVRNDRVSTFPVFRLKLADDSDVYFHFFFKHLSGETASLSPKRETNQTARDVVNFTPTDT